MDICTPLYGLPLGQSDGGIHSVFNIKYTITYSDYSTLNFPSNYNLAYILRIFKRQFFLLCVVQSSYFQENTNINETTVFPALTRIKGKLRSKQMLSSNERT